MPVGSSPFPGLDLRLVVEGALGAEGTLLTAGECVVLQRILGLSEGALELYARLSLRQPRPFRVSELAYAGDVDAQVEELRSAGLCHRNVPDDLCLPAFSAEELRVACRALGLDARGSRPALEARLLGQRWVREPVILIGHAALLRRVEVLFFQTPHLSRQDLVLDRLGALAWAKYTPTGGPGLFARRGAMTLWERARRREWSPGDVEGLLARGPSGAGLDPWRYAVEARIAELATAAPLERAAGLEALLGQGAPVRVLLSRAWEQAGEPARALQRVLEGRGKDTGEGLACDRTSRRLARALGVRLAPIQPLREARTRTIEVPGGAVARAGPRPLWPTTGGALAPIEAAVIEWLGALGRPALHAEQSPWVGLYALVFADLYFLPIENMLPTAFRSGPVDVGTPDFYRRRREAVDARLALVSKFGMEDYVSKYDGSRLSGLSSVTTSAFLARHAPPAMAACVLGRLVREGWAVAAGLPDLFVAAGPGARLDEAFAGLAALPARLSESAFLVEIKGPTDTLRDDQRIWLDVLVENGIHVELWSLSAK